MFNLTPSAKPFDEDSGSNDDDDDSEQQRKRPRTKQPIATPPKGKASVKRALAKSTQAVKGKAPASDSRANSVNRDTCDDAGASRSKPDPVSKKAPSSDQQASSPDDYEPPEGTLTSPPPEVKEWVKKILRLPRGKQRGYKIPLLSRAELKKELPDVFRAKRGDMKSDSIIRRYTLPSLKFAESYADAKIWWKYLDGGVSKEHAAGYDKFPELVNAKTGKVKLRADSAFKQPRDDQGKLRPHAPINPHNPLEGQTITPAAVSKHLELVLNSVPDAKVLSAKQERAGVKVARELNYGIESLNRQAYLEGSFHLCAQRLRKRLRTINVRSSG